MDILEYVVFNINKKIFSKQSFCSLLILICFISGCSYKIKNESNTNNSMTNQEDENNTSNLTMGVYNKNSTEKLKKEFKIPISNPNESLTAKFENIGKDREVCMSVFYDYKQINFRTDNQDAYERNYIFFIDNYESKSFNFYLEDLKVDNNYHKLLVCFTSGHNQRAKDFENVENDFGINTLYDIYYTENSNTVEAFEFPDNNTFSVPKNVYHDFISASLILNLDFKSDQIEKQQIAFPPNIYRSKPNVPIEMMYNASNETADNAIILLMIEYSQAKINEKEYLLLDLKNAKNSVSKDTFKFMAPEKSGLYEVYAIIIYDPFDLAKIENLMPDYSYRFTLEVN